MHSKTSDFTNAIYRNVANGINIDNAQRAGVGHRFRYKGSIFFVELCKNICTCGEKTVTLRPLRDRTHKLHSIILFKGDAISVHMIYGYIRASSDKQTVENQRFEITEFCRVNNLVIDGWIEETISGTKAYGKRRLGKLLKKIQKGDTIICSELSRLGRSLFMIMEILSICMKKECRVWTIKDGYRLGEDIQSKVLAFAFGLSAEIERNLISQRTKEALARLKSEGRRLGRPPGRSSDKQCYKLHGKEQLIRQMRADGHSFSRISKTLGVTRNTVRRYYTTFVENPSFNGRSK